MSNLICDGSELGFQDCSAGAPDSSCLDHSFDSIVFCGKEGVSTGIAENTIRLLSHDGSPSVDGLGRVECFMVGVGRQFASLDLLAELQAWRARLWASLVPSHCLTVALAIMREKIFAAR